MYPLKKMKVESKQIMVRSFNFYMLNNIMYIAKLREVHASVVFLYSEWCIRVIRKTRNFNRFAIRFLLYVNNTAFKF